MVFADVRYQRHDKRDKLPVRGSAACCCQSSALMSFHVLPKQCPSSVLCDQAMMAKVAMTTPTWCANPQ